MDNQAALRALEVARLRALAQDGFEVTRYYKNWFGLMRFAKFKDDKDQMKNYWVMNEGLLMSIERTGNAIRELDALGVQVYIPHGVRIYYRNFL